MFRLWIKEIKDNHLVKDITVNDESNETRTHKVLKSLEKACEQFDLSIPIWLDKNISEFKSVSKTRFTGDSFIESIDFDYLEISIIEED
ncbi:MAG: hypothetical protein J5515_02930 [Lachnospiraceae bacterium]|jgi:hypothetical protein|nr:hypothetical protein [Lachnospiraceae bacterium]